MIGVVFFFNFSPASFHLSCCFLKLIKTLWWQGGIYLHLHAMPFHASLCFPLSKHKCFPCVAPSLSLPLLHYPLCLPPLQSTTYLITPMCRLFVVPPLLTPLHPPAHSQEAPIFTPCSLFPCTLLQPPSSLKQCHLPLSSTSHVHTPFSFVTYLRSSPQIEPPVAPTSPIHSLVPSWQHNNF